MKRILLKAILIIATIAVAAYGLELVHDEFQTIDRIEANCTKLGGQRIRVSYGYVCAKIEVLN
jgi:uncharacterized membrane protein YcjF (UPF0283 family)